MKTKSFLHAGNIILICTCTAILLTPQAFCKDSKAPGAANKTQVKNTTTKKTAPFRRINPAVSPSSFKPEMPLREAIDILRNSTIPPLNIVVMWRDVDQNADITPDTPIGIDGVSGVPLKIHLSLLLMSLSSSSLAQLGYVIKENVIIIGTKDSLPKQLITRVYDVSDIVAPPSMGGMMPGIGMMPMPYGNMMPYGLGGVPGALTPYGYPGYNSQSNPNQGYLNRQQPSYNNQNASSGFGIMTTR